MNLFKFFKSYFFDQFTLHFGGGGGGGTTQTTSTVQNTNVPEYARPYVETMLGATQEQLFQGTRGPDVTNPETGEVTRGDFNITGFKPYQAYGGTYDQNKTLPDGKPNPNYGKQLTYDATAGIAGFTPDQLAAQRGIAGMRQDPAFANAGTMAQQAGQSAYSTANQALGYGAQGQQSGLQGQQLGIAGGQKYGEMGAGYGAQGAGYGQQAAG